MRTLLEIAAEKQATAQTENSIDVSTRKIGIEVVRSAALASEFFYGPRPGRLFRIPLARAVKVRR